MRHDLLQIFAILVKTFEPAGKGRADDRLYRLSSDLYQHMIPVPGEHRSLIWRLASCTRGVHKLKDCQRPKWSEKDQQGSK